MTIHFDSHKFASRLSEAGMAPALATVEAEMTGDVMRELTALDARLERTDTKIDEAKITLNARIDLVEARLEAKIADSRADVIKWVVSIGILQSSLIAAMILKMMH